MSSLLYPNYIQHKHPTQVYVTIALILFTFIVYFLETLSYILKAHKESRGCERITNLTESYFPWKHENGHIQTYIQRESFGRVVWSIFVHIVNIQTDRDTDIQTEGHKTCRNCRTNY